MTKTHFASTRLRCSSSRGLSSKASLSAHWWQGGHGGVWTLPSKSLHKFSLFFTTFGLPCDILFPCRHALPGMPEGGRNGLVTELARATITSPPYHEDLSSCD